MRVVVRGHMAKYGRGLNREIVGGLNRGLVSEPFNISSAKKFASERGWDVPETYINVALANGSSSEHSGTYKKYFRSMGEGRYTVLEEYRGNDWK